MLCDRELAGSVPAFDRCVQPEGLFSRVLV